MKKASVKMFLVVMALVLALCSSALAESKTATVFGEMYGDEFKATIENGTLIESGESVELGDIVYTLEEVVFADGTLYGTGIVSVKEGANVVLIVPDYSVNDAAGYQVHQGEEAPADAETYQSLAYKTAARVMRASIIANGVMVNGELVADSIGAEFIPQKDGTYRFTFEISNEQGDLVQQDAYELSFFLRNIELYDTDGFAPEETWETMENWSVTVK